MPLFYKSSLSRWERVLFSTRKFVEIGDNKIRSFKSLKVFSSCKVNWRISLGHKSFCSQICMVISANGVDSKSAVSPVGKILTNSNLLLFSHFLKSANIWLARASGYKIGDTEKCSSFGLWDAVVKRFSGGEISDSSFW